MEFPASVTQVFELAILNDVIFLCKIQLFMVQTRISWVIGFRRSQNTTGGEHQSSEMTGLLQRPNGPWNIN